MAELCEKVILALFACPIDSASASVNSPSSSSRPTPRLSEFIAYALYRTRLPVAVTHQALYLLKRLKSRFPAARGSSGHRLFISALMLASKSSCDDTYSNKSWTIVGQGLFSLREVNQMERELFGYLGYKVNVEPEELDSFVKGLEQGRIHTHPESASASSSPASSPALASNEEEFRAAPVPTLAASDVSSPAAESMAGPHRGSVSARHARQPSNAAAFNSRASISGYPVSQHMVPSSSISASAPTSVGMVKSASLRHERQTSGHVVFNHPFVANPRDRCRPYTMPTHSMPLSAPAPAPMQQERYYATSPTASISSASICSSASYAPSSVAASTSSPSGSMSGRTTPDTPPSDYENSPWGEASYLSDRKLGSSPTAMDTTMDSKYFAQSAAAGYAPQQHSVDTHLHPYNYWRS